MKKNLKLTIICLLVALLAGGLFYVRGGYPLQASSGGQIAYVNIQEVAQIHPAFQEVQMKYQEEMMRIQEKMSEEAEELGEEATEEDLDVLQREAEMELQETQQLLIQDALDKVGEDVEEIASKEGFEIVLQKEHVLAGGTNITDLVLQTLEE